MANSIIIWGWLPPFFQLNPGEGYRNVAGLVAVIVAIPAPFVYGIILMFKKTKHRFLKVMSVILNLAVRRSCPFGRTTVHHGTLSCRIDRNCEITK